jgi:hypothetical protein
MNATHHNEMRAARRPASEATEFRSEVHPEAVIACTRSRVIHVRWLAERWTCESASIRHARMTAIPERILRLVPLLVIFQTYFISFQNEWESLAVNADNHVGTDPSATLVRPRILVRQRARTPRPCAATLAS